MRILFKTLLCGTALLAGPALVRAQSAPQWVAVPPGFTAVLVPDNAATASVPVMPDPQAMIQQMNAMAAQAEQNAEAMQAQFASMQNGALNGAQSGPGQASGVVITTISDGTHSCTQRIVYPGNGAQAKVQLTSTANGCALEGMGQATPVLLPNATKPAPAAPKLIEAQAPTQTPGTEMVADRD